MMVFDEYFSLDGFGAAVCAESALFARGLTRPAKQGKRGETTRILEFPVTE
jgi:hypothetical protein